MSLTQSEVIEKVRNTLEPHEYKYGYSPKFNRKKCESCVKSLLEIMKKTLENGEDVLISDFGKFCIREKNERKGRNPMTGDRMQIKARRVVTFKCSGLLRKAISKKSIY